MSLKCIIIIIIETLSASPSLSQEVRPRPAEKFTGLVGCGALTVSKMARRGLKHSHAKGSVLYTVREVAPFAMPGHYSRTLGRSRHTHDANSPPWNRLTFTYRSGKNHFHEMNGDVGMAGWK